MLWRDEENRVGRLDPFAKRRPFGRRVVIDVLVVERQVTDLDDGKLQSGRGYLEECIRVLAILVSFSDQWALRAPSMGKCVSACKNWTPIRGKFGSRLTSKVEKVERKPFDLFGLITFIVAMVALNVVIGQGSALGWSSPTVLLLTALFVVSAVAFLLKIESSNPFGFLDLKLFRNTTFTGATLSNFLLNGAAGTLLVTLTLV